MKRFQVEQTQKSSKLNDNSVEWSDYVLVGGGAI